MYNVVTPFVIASLVAGYLIYVMNNPQMSGATIPYFLGLPRDRQIVWDVQIAYVGCVILWLEAIILVGTYFKLGGAGMTPIYRLHPETFVFPFLVTAVVMACICTTKSRVFWSISAIILLVITLYSWVSNNAWGDAYPENNYLPPRDRSLTFQLASTVILSVACVIALALCRRYWKQRQVGEIL